jgi:Toprim domain-containing protein
MRSCLFYTAMIQKNKTVASDTEIIRAGLRQNMAALAYELAPGGYRDGNHYLPVNPARAGDTRPGSLVIDIYGPEAGRFCDFASPDMKGDAIDFIGLMEFGLMPPDARRDREVWAWARKWLSLPAAERAAPKEFAPRPGDDAPRPDEAKQESAFKWWTRADKLAPGSAGWTYLNVARRIPILKLKRPPGAIRTLSRLKYNRDDASKGETFPGLITCMTDGKGKIRAVHRTYLRSDGLGKADVAKTKMMWPSTKGLSIRLARGRSGRSPEECARRGECDDRLVLIEGIEDGLSWSLFNPDDRVCAVGAFSLFKSAPLFDCAKDILIVADNDEIYKTGQLDAMALELKSRAQGREVFITRPLDAKDINEALMKAS